MRKYISHTDYAIDSQAKWGESATNSAHDLNTLAVERLAGTPRKVPQILESDNPTNAANQTGDNPDFATDDWKRS